MGIIQAKPEYSKNGPNDEYYTPAAAVELILPFIPKSVKTIWECTAVKESQIVEVLRHNGYNVIPTHINEGFDYFRYEPEDYDIIITNPPYSCKDQFLQRAFNLGKPFMFLLPITTLEGFKRNKMFRDNRIQLIIPDRRFSFNSGGSGAWFQTSWFTSGLNLKNDLNFIPSTDKEKSIIQRLNKFKFDSDFINGYEQAA
jgi:hypothetical protein